MRKKNFKKIKNTTGIYVNQNTGTYYAEKRIKGTLFTKSFDTLENAKRWHERLQDINLDDASLISESSCSTLKIVWQSMQTHHFPLLATSTKEVWIRRYKLLERFENLPIDQITPSKITEWVQYWVNFFSREEYQENGRGKMGRCNLNNELNMLVTIFNWYKQSEQFEKEALLLTNPVKTKHKKLGFIRPIPDRKKQIDLNSAFLFFEFLKPLYRDLAMMQFYTAGRIGEVAGIQWSNVDLENRRLIIKETCVWDMKNKIFIELKSFPKNRETRPVYITDEIMEVINRRLAFKSPNNDFVFHVDGSPLNYCTIQLNYRGAQRKSGVPFTGTHILRHGMAKLARKVGGGLDAVLAMTGHKDLKLADHYSKSNEDDQKEFSEKIMRYIREQKSKNELENDSINVLKRINLKAGTNH